MSIYETFKTVMSQILDTTQIKTVFGDPIRTENKVVIPAAKVKYMFWGGGGGGHTQSQKDNQREAEEDGCNGIGGGGGGGAGVSTRAVGVYEITDKETKFIPVVDTKYIVMMVMGFLFVMYKISKKSER